MSVVFPLFSTPLYYDNINLNDSLRVESLEYDEASHAHISKDQFIFDNTSFLDVRCIVETHLRRYIGEELRIDGGLQLTHTSSWVCRHRRGDRSQQHLHSNSMFSGILYLQCDEDSGDIEFSIPHIIPTYTSSTLNLQHHVVEKISTRPPVLLRYPATVKSLFAGFQPEFSGQLPGFLPLIYIGFQLLPEKAARALTKKFMITGVYGSVVHSHRLGLRTGCDRWSEVDKGRKF